MLPLLNNTGKETRPFQFSELAFRKDLRSYYGADHHLIIDLQTPEAKLYSVPSDPVEAHNLAPSQPDKLQSLRRILADFMDTLTPGKAADIAPASPKDLEQLKSLGYVK